MSYQINVGINASGQPLATYTWHTVIGNTGTSTFISGLNNNMMIIDETSFDSPVISPYKNSVQLNPADTLLAQMEWYKEKTAAVKTMDDTDLLSKILSAGSTPEEQRQYLAVVHELMRREIKIPVL